MLLSKNSYLTLLYFFVNVMLLGLFLAILQLELFLAFFWIIEFTVVFISLLLIFYLNVEGVQNYFNVRFFYLFIYLFLFLYYLVFLFFYFTNKKLNINFFFFFFDNFYDSNFLFILNDFSAIFMSYYVFNSFEFLLVGFILFITSVIVILLNFFIKKKFYQTTPMY